jgi:putative surface-exposed virulence protein
MWIHHCAGRKQIRRQPRTSSKGRGPAHRPIRTAGFEPLESRSMLTATLWVNPNVAPGGNIFSTISGAIAAAHAGDTIKVVAGSYAENVDVTKPLTIIGRQVPVGGAPVGASVLTASSPGSGTGFTLDAGGITVKNFTITKEDVGIRTNNKFSGFKIQSNIFNDDTTGIEFDTSLTSSANNTISGNLFNFSGAQVRWDIRSGIATQNVSISHNTFMARSQVSSVEINGGGKSSNIQIVNNQFGSALVGDFEAKILLANATKSKIDGNTILNPSGQLPFTPGILVANVSNSEIAGNTLIDTDPSPGDGIEVDDLNRTTSGNKVSGNTISGFFNGILVFDACVQNTIAKNTITNSHSAGIALQVATASNNIVTSNTVTQGDNNGIFVSGSGNTISKNIVSDNGAVGILLDGRGADKNTTGNKLLGNTVNDNGSFGIELDGDASGKGNGITLSKNVISENAASGIYLNVSSSHILSGNNVNHNKDAGIVAVASTGNMLSGNLCNFNASEGIVLENSSDHNLLSKNTAAFNLNGIELIGSSDNTLSGNITTRSTQHGVYLLNGASHNMLSGNLSNNNSGDGFLTTGASNMNTFSKNTANNNLLDGFDVVGDGHTLTNNTARGNGENGLELAGGSNDVAQGNIASDNADIGLFVHGAVGATISGNTTTGNAGAGIRLDATTSMVSGNTAKNNGGDGIELQALASGNTISGNTALGNGDLSFAFDLFDSWGDTLHNIWLNNTANTRSPAGLG